MDEPATQEATRPDRRQEARATPNTRATTERPPIIPRRTPEEARAKGARLVAALDAVAEIGGDDDHRETLEVLRAAGLVAPEGGPKA